MKQPDHGSQNISHLLLLVNDCQGILLYGYSIIGCNPPKFPLLFSVTLCFVAHETPGSGLSPQDESLPPDCGLRLMPSECSEATTQEDRLAVKQHKAQLFKSTELRLRYFLPSDHNVLYFAKI